MGETRSGGSPPSDGDETTYPLGSAARLTGLTPDRLRAWERRYGLVEPLRTSGGTRRYRISDIERLQLARLAVDAGHRVGTLASLSNREIERLVKAEPPDSPTRSVDEVMAALIDLDAATAERLVSLQLAILGPARFARVFAIPLLRALGEGWTAQRVCIASEHLGSAILRSALGAALRPTAASTSARSVLFASPSGERHELGLLIAALTCLDAGGNPVYLGPDLPAEEIAQAAEKVDAAAVALGIAAMPDDRALEQVEAVRSLLPKGIDLWVGGRAVRELRLPHGVIQLDSLESLETVVSLAQLRRTGGP